MNNADIKKIDILWVDDNYRSIGVGSQLMQKAQETAKEKGCSLIHLDTFDFQAKDFYLKHGFEVFGVLENCPPGHKRTCLNTCPCPSTRPFAPHNVSTIRKFRIVGDRKI